jgi:protein SCO1
VFRLRAIAASAAAIAAVVCGAAPQGSISGHFTLDALDGREVSDATYRGKWLVVYFGYTYCPDVCPTVLVRLGRALDQLGPVADRIQPLFITVDPARDTAAHLAKYMSSFNRRIIGLRGDPDQIHDAAREFHVFYRARALGNGEYTVDHSSFLYVMSPDGHFAKLLADSLTADQFAQELRALAGSST